jgi:hypothetical protein
VAEHDVENSLPISKVIRRLRGGSQAHMVECEDGRFYVAKFSGNPQGNRTLINEWIVSHAMSHLGVSTPGLRVLSMPASVRERDNLYFSVGSKRVPVAGEFHLGSPYPVNPDTTAIFDFLPDRLQPKIVNLGDFATTWVLDKWFYNTDIRQAVFVRAKDARPIGFRAFMIDHGMCFDGIHWELRDALSSRPDWNRSLYDHLDMPTECERTLAQIDSMSSDILIQAAHSFPASWLQDVDRECLDALIRSLLARQCKLHSIIDRHLDNQLAADNGSIDNGSIDNGSMCVAKDRLTSLAGAC